MGQLTVCAGITTLLVWSLRLPPWSAPILFAAALVSVPLVLFGVALFYGRWATRNTKGDYLLRCLLSCGRCGLAHHVWNNGRYAY